MLGLNSVPVGFAYPYKRRPNIAYDSRGKVGLAIEDHNKAIELNPDDAEAYYNRGVAYGVKGEVYHAIVDFTKVIELNPDDAEAYYNRGVVYHAKGDYDRAIADYNMAIKLKPDLGRSLYQSVGRLTTLKAIMTAPLQTITWR